jgi:hypothetical protein
LNAWIKDDGWNRDSHGAAVGSSWVVASSKRTGLFVSKEDVCTSTLVGSTNGGDPDPDKGLVTRTSASVYQFLTSTAGAFIFNGAQLISDTNSAIFTTSAGGDFPQFMKLKNNVIRVLNGITALGVNLNSTSFNARWDMIGNTVNWVQTGMGDRQGSIMIGDVAFKSNLDSVVVYSPEDGRNLNTINMVHTSITKDSPPVSGNVIPLGNCRAYLKGGMDAHAGIYSPKRVSAEFAYILGVPRSKRESPHYPKYNTDYLFAQWKGAHFSFTFSHNTSTGFQELPYGQKGQFVFDQAGHAFLPIWAGCGSKVQINAFYNVTMNNTHLTDYGYAMNANIVEHTLVHAPSSFNSFPMISSLVAGTNGPKIPLGWTPSNCPSGNKVSTKGQTCKMPVVKSSVCAANEILLMAVVCEPHIYKNHAGYVAYV